MVSVVLSLHVFLVVYLANSIGAVDTNYAVGTGIYDVTGPASEINMVN